MQTQKFKFWGVKLTGKIVDVRRELIGLAVQVRGELAAVLSGFGKAGSKLLEP